MSQQTVTERGRQGLGGLWHINGPCMGTAFESPTENRISLSVVHNTDWFSKDKWDLKEEDGINRASQNNMEHSGVSQSVSNSLSFSPGSQIASGTEECCGDFFTTAVPSSCDLG